MYIFLKFLKISINDIKHINNAFKYWQDLYALCTDASHPKVLFVSTKTQDDFEKILYLIDKPVPVIFVVRDFISILKSSLNHHDEDTTVPYRIKNLKLHSPFFLPEPSPIFHNLEDLEELSKEHNRQFLFQIAKRIALLNPQSVIALDFTRLAQKDNSEFFDAFNLNPSSHPLFSSQINAYKLLYALPVSLVGGGVELKLMHIKDFVFCKDYIDVSKIFLDENLIPSLIIAIKSEDLELCDKALLKEFKSYLKNYTRALALRIKSLKSFTEEDLIAFLLENPSLKSKFIKAWSEDAAYLSKNFPQLFSRFCYTHQLQASKSSSKHRTT